MSETKRQIYQCSKCKATDEVVYFMHETIFPAINCFNCGAGRGAERKAMLMNREGMFPVVSEV